MYRAFVILTLLTPLYLSACGDEHKTVVVTPPPGATVVVPQSGAAKICTSGQTTC
jgi:hypothetical protein